MNLIEILFENPLLIAVIIGLLTSILRSGNKEIEQKKKTPTQKHPKTQPDKQTTLKSNNTHDVNEMIEKRFKQIENQKEPLYQKSEHIKTISKIKKLQTEKRKIKKKVNLNSPLEGMIWSEILREPRSKRLYNRYIRK